MPTAYSYVRFSTPEQLKGDSLRRQTELSQAYAEEHGLTLDTTLHFRDLGISAFDRSNIKRGALGAFLGAIEQGRVEPGSFLLVESLDRLSRAEVLDALGVFTDILKRGITIVTLADRMTYSQESLRSNFGNLIISITIMARAHEESAMKSRRLKAAWSNKRERIGEAKLTARCPMWMRLSEDRKKLEFIPERQETVRQIIEWSRNGFGVPLICKRLNEAKIPTFTKSAGGWQTSSIGKIVASHALYGAFKMSTRTDGNRIQDGDLIEGYFPAIISKEEFFLLQSIRSERRSGGAKARKGKDVPNLFSGLVKCGYCGESMVLLGGPRQKRTSGELRPIRKFLACDGARRGHGCYGVQWGYTALETSFLTFCRGLQLDALIREMSAESKSDVASASISQQVAAAKSEVDDVQKRLSRMLDVMEQGDTPASVLARIRKLELRLVEKTEVLESLTQQLNMAASSSQYRADEIADVRRLIKSMGDMDEQTRFNVRAALAEHLRHMIGRIDMFPAGRLHTPEELERLRNELAAQGFSKKRIEAYLKEANYRTAPPRQGRGARGRYGPNAASGRFYTIKGKTGGFRVVYPDHDNPEIIIVEVALPTSKV